MNLDEYIQGMDAAKESYIDCPQLARRDAKFMLDELIREDMSPDFKEGFRDIWTEIHKSYLEENDESIKSSG